MAWLLRGGMPVAEVFMQILVILFAHRTPTIDSKAANKYIHNSNAFMPIDCYELVLNMRSLTPLMFSSLEFCHLSCNSNAGNPSYTHPLYPSAGVHHAPLPCIPANISALTLPPLYPGD